MRLWVTVDVDIDGEDSFLLSEEAVLDAVEAALNERGVESIIGWEDVDWCREPDDECSDWGEE